MAEPSETATPSSTTTEPTPSTSTQETAPETCASCSKTSTALKACTKCHSVPYCNRDCQKAHYKSHKKVCASLAQEYVKLNPPTMASRAPPRSTDRNTGFKKWEFDT